MKRPTDVYLNYGLGWDSLAILILWIFFPQSRDFALDQLTVITAMTGDEWEETRWLNERYLLPLLRKHGIRYVQLARAGKSQTDGIVVLDDSREPQRLFIEGGYRLSQEMIAGGTVPQVASGKHLCAVKYKAWVIERWLIDERCGEPARRVFGYNADEEGRTRDGGDYSMSGSIPFRSVVGYNADETARIEKANDYATAMRAHEYPLLTMGWGRVEVESFVRETLGIEWAKSCCTYCPFANTNGGRARLIQRYQQEPSAAARALLIEYASLALNPRMGLFGGKTKPITLHALIAKAGIVDALGAYDTAKAACAWALYHVRRIYYPKTGTRPQTDRSTRVVARGSFDDLVRDLAYWGAVESDGDMHRVWILRRQGTERPAVEELYVVAPAVIDEKQKVRFEDEWARRTWDLDRHERPLHQVEPYNAEEMEQAVLF